MSKKMELFTEFISKNHIVIADKNPAARRRLIKTLVDMGAKRQSISSLANYSEILEVIHEKQPQLILADFDLNGGSSFELFREYRDLDEKLKAVLIMVTSNISQSTVAMAAEEDVDSFIIKPYTVNSLEKSLVNAIMAKVYPSDYMKLIEKGKDLLSQAKYDESYSVFETAIPLSKTPSLAHFYQGQINYIKNIMEGAKGDYKKGLEVNAIHFKCQVGLFELFMKDNKIYEAYEIIRNIMKYFPSNPERLKQVLKLAIQTQNYEDIESFYESFKEIEIRDKEVVKYMCSALFILGKHYFNKGEGEKAREAMKNLMSTSQGEIKFIKAVVTEYAQRGMFDEAKEVFNRSDYSDRDTQEYKISQYLSSYNDYELGKRVSEGLLLFHGDIKDPFAAQFTLDALHDAQSFKKFNDLKEEVIYLWPEFFTRVSKAA